MWRSSATGAPSSANGSVSFVLGYPESFNPSNSTALQPTAVPIVSTVSRLRLIFAVPPDLAIRQ